MPQEPHPHSHEDHDHGHARQPGFWERLRAALNPGGHSHGYEELAEDQAFLNNEAGIRTVWLALAALLLTSIIQLMIMSASGSVALFADTVHNLGDGLNSVPLLIAFYLARRAATRRYTYGFGKAEDLAGVFIVLSIAFSAGVILWESFQKLLDPQPLDNLGWLAVAGVVGFLGNEAVALLQIRTGKRIGSAALVADGLHARTDGLTSLAVIVAAAGSWLGYPIADPIIGILIGMTILFVTRDAAKTVWYRLMDAIEPEMLDRAESAVRQLAGVKALQRVRMRWIGHRLQAEVHIAVNARWSVTEGHRIAEEVRHALFHQVANLDEVTVHIEPWSSSKDDDHELTLDHEKVPQRIEARG